MGQVGWTLTLRKPPAAWNTGEGHLQVNWEDLNIDILKEEMQDAEHGLRSASNSTVWSNECIYRYTHTQVFVPNRILYKYVIVCAFVSLNKNKKVGRRTARSGGQSMAERQPVPLLHSVPVELGTARQRRRHAGISWEEIPRPHRVKE